MNNKYLLVCAIIAVLLIMVGCAEVQPFQQLTNSSEFEGYPDWSPDGNRIVYVRESDYGDPHSREIWIMNSDGSAQTKLGQGESPKFSPDSRKVVYASASDTKDKSDTLELMNVDGTEAITLINDTDHWFLWPTWSPDGKRISYIRDRNELWTINADGDNQIQITIDEEFLSQTSFLGVHAWSPDGKKIAFERADESRVWNIWIIDADGTNLHQLTFDEESNWLPDWSHDGNKVAFKADIGSSIDTINPDGSGRETLLSARDNKGWKVVTTPSWSPDGRSIAFEVVYDGEQLLVDIWVLTLSN